MSEGILTTLRRVAHTRSGDKGDTATISVIAYAPELYDLIVEQVTPARIADRLGAAVKGRITRYQFPAIGALNFTLEGALGGGVSRTLALDVCGKALCSALLDLPIVVPEHLIGHLLGSDDAKSMLCATWRLVSYSRAAADRNIHPFGDDAIGWLQYGADGRVSATLARRHRPPLEGPVGDDWSGPQDEWAAAGSSFLGYTGTWLVDGQEVRHHVDACSYPNWTGKTLVRRFAFRGDPDDPTLSLTTPPNEISAQASLSSTLTWRREGRRG